jgi:hypothetical protein
MVRVHRQALQEMAVQGIRQPANTQTKRYGVG